MRHIAFAVWIMLLCMAAEAKPLNVSVRAQHAILINPENGAILFQKGAHEAHYPASILKLATALYVLDGLQPDLDQKVIASSEALEVIRADIKQADFLLYPPYLLEHDGVMMGLKVGNAYTIRTLLHGLLLASGNDAANVLAEGVAGSIDHFMEGLNRYLKAKGITNTRFQNPSGLHHPAQLTTAADMAKIAALCFSNSHFREIIQSLKFEPLNADNIQNTNRMLQRGRYRYPSLIGGKTGYIASSGYNFVAAAEEKGRELIVVLLGCEKSEDRFKDTITLFEAAFRQRREKRILFPKDSTTFRKEVPKAQDPLSASIEEDLILFSYPAEEMELQGKILWKIGRLPILKGDEVGRLEVLGSSGKIIASAPLYATSDVYGKAIAKWPLLFVVIGVLALGVYMLKKRGKPV